MRFEQGYPSVATSYQAEMSFALGLLPPIGIYALLRRVCARLHAACRHHVPRDEANHAKHMRLRRFELSSIEGATNEINTRDFPRSCAQSPPLADGYGFLACAASLELHDRAPNIAVMAPMPLSWFAGDNRFGLAPLRPCYSR